MSGRIKGIRELMQPEVIKRHGKRKKRPEGLRVNGPIAPVVTTWIRSAPDIVRAHALMLAGGDKRRLQENRDGSVTVFNNPIS